MRTIEQVRFTPSIPRPERVAAYARVSSGKEAMLHSLSAQVDYYSTYIRRHPGWEYVGVYTDEAKTGTKDSRENFQRLLADCRMRFTILDSGGYSTSCLFSRRKP